MTRSVSYYSRAYIPKKPDIHSARSVYNNGQLLCVYSHNEDFIKGKVYTGESKQTTGDIFYIPEVNNIMYGGPHLDTDRIGNDYPIFIVVDGLDEEDIFQLLMMY